jgi:SHAQKYF class myb-like DNA-binding protein
MDQQLSMNKKIKREVFKTGRWSNDEESLFEEGLDFFGKDWRKIQRYIKTRSLLQVRSHAQKYFLMV